MFISMRPFVLLCVQFVTLFVMKSSFGTMTSLPSNVSMSVCLAPVNLTNPIVFSSSSMRSPSTTVFSKSRISPLMKFDAIF